jgi:hypothetical protein
MPEQEFCVWHVVPLYPTAQVHVKLFTPSAHVPPFRQGFGLQSLMFVPHVVPEYPAAQLHA